MAQAAAIASKKAPLDKCQKQEQYTDDCRDYALTSHVGVCVASGLD